MNVFLTNYRTTNYLSPTCTYVYQQKFFRSTPQNLLFAFFGIVHTRLKVHLLWGRVGKTLFSLSFPRERESIIDFFNSWEYTFGVERRFDKRQLGRLAAGGLATMGGTLLDSRTAWVASGRSGLVVPGQMVSEPNRAYALEVATSGGFGGQYDGQYLAVFPGVAAGDAPPLVPKPMSEYGREFKTGTRFIAEKPRFGVEELSRIKEPLKSIETPRPFIGIGIDDGFDESAMKLILSVAKKKAITFTDLTKGLQRKQYKVLIQDMINSEIVEFANHTETHRDQRNAPVRPGSPNRRPTWEEFVEDLDASERFLNELGQTCLPYVRPPGGSWDFYTQEWNTQHGYLPITWKYNIEDMPVDILRPGDIILAHYRAATSVVFETWVNRVMARGLIPTAFSNVVASASPEFWKRFEKKAA